MKQFTLATLIVLAVALPAAAGGTPEPAMTPEMVADAATQSTTENIDGLMVAIAYILLFAVAGGAF